MRGEYSAIHEAIVDDPDFRGLSPHAKTCWYTLKLMLGASGIGLIRASRQVLEDATGIERTALYRALNELVGGKWLIVQGDVLWLRNGLRHNPNLKITNENHRKAIIKHLAGLPCLEIVNAFATYYGLATPFTHLEVAWDTQWYPNGIPDQEVGSRTEEVGRRASANADGEAPPKVEPTYGEVMAVVRKELHLGRSNEECGRSGSIAREFAGKGVAAQDIIDACRGTRKLIEAGLVDGAKPGQEVGLRFLRVWKYDSRYLWDAAIDAERLGAGLTRASPSNAKAQPERLRVPAA